MRQNIATSRKAEGQNPERSMNTALIIGVILTLVLAMPAVLWLTKLIRPPKPEEESIHRKIAEARKDARKRMERLPPL